ncbi:MAG: hypothetical protein ACR2MB_08355 [Acidimicrobiales bacterium]
MDSPNGPRRVLVFLWPSPRAERASSRAEEIAMAHVHLIDRSGRTDWRAGAPSNWVA